MKKIFTLLLGAFLTVSASFAAPKQVLYLTTPVPFATGDNLNDQIMFDLIEGLGYIVTAEQITSGGTTEGYDAIFFSEAIPSGDGGWSTYSDAPLPMVVCKVWGTKASALGWITTENGDVDYGNSPDSMMVAQDDEHPITTGLDDPLKVITNNGGEADALAWVNTADYPSGTTVVYSTEDDDAESALVAIDDGTVLNGHTLANPVVILGIHQNGYDALTDDVGKLIDNCLLWVMGEDIGGGPEAVNDNDVINTTVYPNPSNGMVNVLFDQFVTSAQITILALDGRTIRTSDIYNAESVSLDLSDLTSGIYILNITGKDINYTQSISLQN